MAACPNGERPTDTALGQIRKSSAGMISSKKLEIDSAFGYQVGVEGVEEVPSDGALGGASGAGVETGSGAGAGGGAGFRFTTRFLAAFRAFFFIDFLAFFFFAKTRFTETMFRLCKPNNACAIFRFGLYCRCLCHIRVYVAHAVDSATEWPNS